MAAQEPAKVAGDNYQLISENARVRILDVKLAPGQKTAMHSHPDLLVVILATQEQPVPASCVVFETGFLNNNAPGSHRRKNTEEKRGHTQYCSFNDFDDNGPLFGFMVRTQRGGGFSLLFEPSRT